MNCDGNWFSLSYDIGEPSSGALCHFLQSSFSEHAAVLNRYTRRSFDMTLWIGESDFKISLFLLKRLRGDLITGHKYLCKEKNRDAPECFMPFSIRLARTKTWKLLSDKFK